MLVNEALLCPLSLTVTKFYSLLAYISWRKQEETYHS